jgi:hypothetical protein
MHLIVVQCYAKEEKMILRHKRHLGKKVETSRVLCCFKFRWIEWESQSQHRNLGGELLLDD